jgi:hypothetical protein
VIGQSERVSSDHDAALSERFTMMLRREVHEQWERSGRPSGKAEPPAPTALVKRRTERGQDRGLAVTTEPYELYWYFPWDGSDRQLVDWIETTAEEYWAEYVQRNYHSRPALE